MTTRGFRRVEDGSSVPRAKAYAAWAAAAYPVLITTASVYHAVITYRELAEEVQAASGIRTSVPYRYWIGAVLAIIVQEAHRRGDPKLTALVVHTTDGMVGEGYKEVLAVAGEPPIEDTMKREEHAAEARLLCYKRLCPVFPPDGGAPALAPMLQEKVARQRTRNAQEPARICPHCFVELPASGVCSYCY